MSVPWNEIAPLNEDDTDSSSGEVEVIHLSDDDKVNENQTVQIQHEEVAPPTLLETCARFIGQNLPFELVQLHPQRVPEEVQKRIAYWSFPLEEKRLVEIAKTMHGISEYTISRVMKVINGLGENKKRKALRRWDEDHYDSYEEDDDYFQYTKKTSINEFMKMTQIGELLLRELARYYEKCMSYVSIVVPKPSVSVVQNLTIIEQLIPIIFVEMSALVCVSSLYITYHKSGDSGIQ